MKKFLCVLLATASFSCNNDASKTGTQPSATGEKAGATKGFWEGTFTNGMKGAKISFEVSADGKEMKDVTFQGYWRCDGKLDLTTLGPKKSFSIEGKIVSGVITEPEGGGATAARFELHGEFKGDSAVGTFRMNINALACDTYVLNWTAYRK